MFRFIKSIDGSMIEPRKMPCGDGTYHVGTALYMVAGLLEKATGSVRVQYISMEDKTLASDGEILAFPVMPGMIFEVPVEDIDATIHKLGAAVQIFTDGEQITDAAVPTLYASTASGSYSSAVALPPMGGALIYDMCGAAADGDRVHVRLNF